MTAMEILNQAGDVVLWLANNWEQILKIWVMSVGIASIIAALTPTKKDNEWIAKLHQYVNTDVIHKAIDFVAMNILYAKNRSKEVKDVEQK